MAGPEDNILGGQDAVIRVGVEADMSEILQQATKFNELIKDANDSFNIMQTVINSTTSRMASLNSATLRLVASARQLRNEYQLIAESSQRIGFMGGGIGEVGAGVTGIGGGDIRELVSTSSGAAGGGYVQSQGGLLVPGGSVEPYKTPSSITDPQQGLGVAVRSGGRATGKAYQAIATMDYGANPPLVDTGMKDPQGNPIKVPMTPAQLRQHLIRNGAGPTALALTTLGRLAPTLTAGLTAAAPYVLPVLGAAVAGYKAVDYLTKGATKYTGLTGGTGVFTSEAEGNMYGLNRGSFVGLQAQKWLSGLTNLAVGPGGYGEIQDALFAAGYKPYGDEQANRMGMQGMRYDQARSTMATLYAKGFQDVGANATLMAVSMESAKTSTASFVSAMDSLRLTAQRTNASMKGLTTAFTTVMNALVSGLGATGNWTNLFSSTFAEAYANSRNAVLRDGGAVADLSKFPAQVQLMNTPAFKQAGITFQNSLMAYSNSPGMADTLARGTDQAADTLLGMLGIGDLRGRDPREIEIILRNMTPQIMALKDSEMARSLVGPEVTSNTSAFIEWLVTNASGDPLTAAIEDKKKDSGANRIKNYVSSSNYFESTFMDRQSESRAKINDFLRANPEDMSNYPVLSGYMNYIASTQKSIGWLDSLIRSGEQGQTYVRYRGNEMTLGQFFTKYGDSPDARRLMESGELEVATSQDGKKPNSLDFSAAYNIQASEKTVQNMSQAELQETFKQGMLGWAKENNSAGDNKLKVSADGILGIG